MRGVLPVVYACIHICTHDCNSCTILCIHTNGPLDAAMNTHDLPIANSI